MDVLLAEVRRLVTPEDAGGPAQVRRTIEERPGRRCDHDGRARPDTTVATALANLYWDRFLSWPDEVVDEELTFTISQFERLHTVDPELVPDVLRPVYDPQAQAGGEDENDVLRLAMCAIRLFDHAEEESSQPGVADHAVALATQARLLGRRLGTLSPEAGGRLASALLSLFDATDDGELLDEADGLVTSFEPAVLAMLADDHTDPSVPELQQITALADVRFRPLPARVRGRT